MTGDSSTPPVADRDRATASFRWHWPLKLATLGWFVLVFSLGAYGMAATWAEWFPYDVLDVPDLVSAKPAVYSFFSGLLGGGIYALRGFYWAVGPQSEHNPRYRYNPNWTLWYVIRPLMGAFLGVFTFAALRAGVATLGTASNDGGANAAYSFAAFLAGFSVTQVLNWMTVIARRIFSVGEAPPDSQRRQDSDDGG